MNICSLYLYCKNISSNTKIQIMAHLNLKGPEEKGSQTGRKLGLCKKKSSEETQAETYQLGVGLGKNKKNRHCKGSGKRLKAGKNIEQE